MIVVRFPPSLSPSHMSTHDGLARRNDRQNQTDEPKIAVALQEYILLLAQAPNGGLRDKPGKGPDAYHTCYNLSGLSSAQHFLLPSSPSTLISLSDGFVDPFARTQISEVVDSPAAGVIDSSAGGQIGAKEEVKMILGKGESEEMARRRMKELYVRAVGWEKKGDSLLIGGADNELVSFFPFFSLRDRLSSSHLLREHQQWSDISSEEY